MSTITTMTGHGDFAFASAVYPTPAAIQACVAVVGLAGADRTKDGWGSPPGWSP